MASWLASQLRAAEGLLEAVDKTVSKTVTTLGLAEGEEQLLGNGELGEYAAARPAASQQASATYTPAHGYSTNSTAHGWDASRAGSGPLPPAGTTTVPGHTRTGSSGFTVRTDGPIPFGGRPPQPPTTSTSAAPDMSGGSRTSSHGALPGPGAAGPTTWSGAGAADGLAAGPAGHSGLPSASGRSDTAPGAAAGSGAVSAASSHKSMERVSSGESGPGAPATSSGGGAPAASSAFAAVTPIKPSGPSSTAATSGLAPDARPSSQSTSGGGPTPGPAGASPTGDSARPASTPSTSNPTPSTAASALASATAAATTSLASATSSAVSHSLSFFNLVADDPPDPPPASTPASSEAVQALQRNVDQLRKRLEASRLENEQLEDMLARAEVQAQQQAALVASLREQLGGLQQGRAASESSLSAQLSVAKASLAEISDKYEASQRSVLVLEGQLAALEESSRRLMEQHSDREGGMLEALRSELYSAESRLASERKAHQASRAAAAAREADLEAQIGGGTAALADLTRALEEANRKLRDLEDEVVSATRARNDAVAQLGGLQRQLEEAGITPQAVTGADGEGGGGLLLRPGGGKGAAAAAAAAAELEALRTEAAQHRRAAQAAKQAAEASAAQVASMAAELEALRVSLESRKDTSQLEAQLREASDMLYLKQTQLERLAAERAAQQLKTERELDAARQELAKVLRGGGYQGGGGGGLGGRSEGGAGGGGHSHDVIPMDALGEPYQRLARHNKVGKVVKVAANFLDSTASTASYALRQYPLARLGVFVYVVLIHLYVYVLIARMQRLATHMEAAVNAPVTDGT